MAILSVSICFIELGKKYFKQKKTNHDGLAFLITVLPVIQTAL